MIWRPKIPALTKQLEPAHCGETTSPLSAILRTFSPNLPPRCHKICQRVWLTVWPGAKVLAERYPQSQKKIVSMLAACFLSVLERTGYSTERIPVWFHRRNTKTKFRLLRFRCSFPELEAKFNANALFLYSFITALRIALHAKKS
jgi:hypothetical protein